ncbi:hypothetical protein P3T36_005985 [Kitasatospora sp. MAP12-15]|uniref:hypothetical protein n=1 Tax=unclassified Kitasatospora TaxID=2633591 RepID=UPI0024747260|nr:hypothetical protein [Kitasatospora sp. MAP12-44]MDH6109092.1 hypothetical protein [Kitasatospora sp. MAP12-44]
MTTQTPTSLTPAKTDLPLRENDDIQGDVIAGFKKDQMVLLFLKFEDGIRARSWLQRLTPRIATTRQVATFNKAFSDARQRSGGDPTGLKATWLGISFTYQGLWKLTDRKPYPDAPKNTTLGAFQQGPVERAADLGDTGQNHPSRWVFGNNKSEDRIHAVLTIAAPRAKEPGPDAMVGQAGTIVWDQDGSKPVMLSYQQFVRTEGAVYAFSPSVTTLRALGEGRLPDQDQTEPGQPVDTFLPYPDMQRKNGKSWFWLFHTINGDQLYRVISIADGTQHTDVLEVPDTRISDFSCFSGINRISCILAMPDRQRVDGVSTYWVFHQGRYRIVSIADGSAHEDRIVVPDRSVTLWNSLTQEQ